MSLDFHATDLMSQEHKADPFSFYARLRAEAPVAKWSIMGVGEIWLVTRYDDVVAVLKDKRFAKDPRNAGRKVREPTDWVLKIMSNNLLRYDDPEHLRLRTLAAKAFRRCGVDHLKPRIEAVVEQHLDVLANARAPDLVRDFAFPVPLMVIAELMGIPQSDHHRMHHWIEAAASPSGPPDMTALSAFLHYLKDLIEQRGREPLDDLISALTQADADGDRMSVDDLVATSVALIIAGHETAVNLLASGALTLMQHREQTDRLINDPGLAASAVDELLRFSAPVESATERFATEDMELNGVAIKRGDLVLAVLASANRDEAYFTAPDELDLGRDPNPHIAFGSGPHYCMGAPLALLQGQAAFSRLFARFPDMQPAVPDHRLRWKQMPILRGLEALPVRLRDT